MWLAFYNPKVTGDALLLTAGTIGDDFAVAETKGSVTVIRDRRNDAVKGVNIFDQQETLGLEGQGQIFLQDEQVSKINQLIQDQDFDVEIAVDNSPKLVVGYVEECDDHEDSDHLSVTQTRVSEDEVLQIVCGASNIDQDQKVIVAKPGAVMPDGMIIWPGELRGVTSNGMICSTDELNLADLSDEDGIWVLNDDHTVGEPLEEVVKVYQ